MEAKKQTTIRRASVDQKVIRKAESLRKRYGQLSDYFASRDSAVKPSMTVVTPRFSSVMR